MIRSISPKKNFVFFKKNFSIGKVHPELEIFHGKLRGTVATNIDNEQYYKFQGIPYARPPIGKFRFKPPSSLDPWNTRTLDATKEGSPSCGGHLLKASKFIGSENCLFLNVYTKNLDTKSLRPVMFNIHGGAFVSGSGGEEIHGPDFLLTQDVVVVTLNYRLGILGFLSLEDPTLEVFGNMGFKDIVMGLRWVQNNIDKFGGDPNNVTIFGQSVGGVAVHLLMCSEMGKGLFHKAIAQSGCALSPWAQGSKNAKAISEVLKNTNEHFIYKRLMKMPVEELYNIQKMMDDVYSVVPSIRRPLGYVVEDPNKDAFLTEDPTKIMLEGKFRQVPFMIGYNSMEALSFNLQRKRFWPGFETCEDMIPHGFGYRIGSEESLSIARKIRKFYFGNDKPAVNSMEKLLMENDLNFVYAIYTTAMNHLRKSSAPVYLYRTSIDTKLNLTKSLLKINHPGAVHYDEMGYLFKNFATPEIVPNSAEDVGMRRFVKLWTNFAKYGNPTPNMDDSLLRVVWKPVSNQEMHYLDIGQDLNVCSNSEELGRIKSLQNLFETHCSRQKRSL